MASRTQAGLLLALGSIVGVPGWAGCVRIEEAPRTAAQSIRGFAGTDRLTPELRRREAVGEQSAVRRDGRTRVPGKRVLAAPKRQAVARRAAKGRFTCGAAEVDITPTLGIPMAGYSLEGKFPEGVSDRLMARALVLEDARGERVALVFADLMGGSRYLLENAAAITETACGIGLERLVLVCSHTHTGPGWYYGNEGYDTLAAVEPGFDRCMADWLSARIADAVVQADRSAVPGGVVIGSVPLWGVSKNRSDAAFCENADADCWTTPPYPGAGAPAGWASRDVHVDPRVTVLAALDEAHRPVAVFATFGCHSTANGVHWDLYSADWPAHAARAVRERVRSPSFVAAVLASAEGDANAYETVRFGHHGAGAELSQGMGRAVGDAIAGFLVTHQAASAPVPIDVRYGSYRLPDKTLPEAELAGAWMIGGATIAGSEEGRSAFYPWLAREPMPGNYPGVPDLQRPKVPGLGPVQAILRDVFDLDAPPTMPFHLVRIGTHAFATVPGEPTAMTAYRVERAVLDALPAVKTAGVLACADDYGGYFATCEEFLAQHYEGSSTIWGRNSAAYVAARVAGLASSTPPPVHEDFSVGLERRVFHPDDRCPGRAPPRPYVTRDVRTVRVRWDMDFGTRIVFGNGPLLVLEEPSGEAWVPVTADDGRVFDDVRQPVAIWRKPGWSPDPSRHVPQQWRCTFRIPAAVAAKELRVRFLPRDCFPGFVVPVPRS
jgi:neutral ceramidase